MTTPNPNPKYGVIRFRIFSPKSDGSILVQIICAEGVTSELVLFPSKLTGAKPIEVINENNNPINQPAMKWETKLGRFPVTGSIDTFDAHVIPKDNTTHRESRSCPCRPNLTDCHGFPASAITSNPIVVSHNARQATKIYRSRPLSATATQWFPGVKIDEVRHDAPGTPNAREKPYFIDNEDDDVVDVDPGDWVVRYEDGRTCIETNENFQKDFIEEGLN